MKTRLWPVLALILGGAFLCGNVSFAAETNSSAAAKSTPGLDAAQAVSTITGVAISPLLGVSGLGVIKYFKTPVEKRARLPWYAQPWFWAPALALVLLVFLKDTLGTALPTAVKKPLDVAETIENKISGLVAAGAFVPLIAAIFSMSGDDTALYGDNGLAMVNVAALFNVLTIPLAIAAFVVVWMVSHVINVFILVSPFTTVDAALKSVRLFVLGTVAGTSWLNPYMGAIWALLIILVCAFLAGWAYRLMVFGWAFVWDMVTLRKRRFQVAPAENWVFTAREIDKTPIRTFGKLSRGREGELVLKYRPCLFLPRRRLTLPPGRYVVGRGLFYSEIVQIDSDTTIPALTLPPRYGSHEQEVSSIYGLAGVEDVGLVKGIKAAWRWLSGAFVGEASAVPLVAV
jgi:hypothetical protein